MIDVPKFTDLSTPRSYLGLPYFSSMNSTFRSLLIILYNKMAPVLPSDILNTARGDPLHGHTPDNPRVGNLKNSDIVRIRQYEILCKA